MKEDKEEFNKYTAFQEACKPLMKYLAENHHPHILAIIEGNRASLQEGQTSFTTDEFLVD